MIILNELKSIIDELTIPDKWIEEKTEEPTALCRSYSFTVVRYIFKKYKLIPDKIVPSIESGIIVLYKDNVELYIEIGNEIEIAAIINKDKNVIESYDIDFNNFYANLDEIVKAYIDIC